MSDIFKRILSSIILLPIVLYFIFAGSFYFLFFTIFCFLVSLYEWLNMVKKIYLKFLGIIFLSFSFFTFYKLAIMDILLIPLFICIFTDIGGYVFGKLFKGPKLTKISPNKTLSGSVGSLFFSILIFSIIIFYFTNNFNLNILIIGLFTSIACQLGDLFFSFLKRKARVKDTGNLLPGHGGFLDRLDGIIIGLPLGLLFIIIVY